MPSENKVLSEEVLLVKFRILLKFRKEVIIIVVIVVVIRDNDNDDDDNNSREILKGFEFSVPI